MLRLQNGRFDAPSRMFHSISEVWWGVLNNAADVKEVNYVIGIVTHSLVNSRIL